MPRKTATRTDRRRRYESKRNFSQSPEPPWQSTPAKTKRANRAPAQRRFVIQKHRARRLHYDLRLEIEGALASWAVPKGFPEKPGDRHLAIRVEDHPLDYGDFEGNIPQGNYGAGAVMLWDRGLYEVLEGDPAEAVKNGRLSIVFAGEKLRGSWLLVRTRASASAAADKEQWLLLKGKDNTWRISQRDDDRSVLSGRTLAEIAAENADESLNKPDARRQPKKTPRPSRKMVLAVADLPAARPDFVAPMKPTLATRLPEAGDWIFEIKFDGYRILAVKSTDEVRLFSRNEIDITREFPAIRDAVAALPADELVIDGEAVALLESGVPSFQRLQNYRSGGKDQPIYFYAFDLLNIHGHATGGLPLRQRKEMLEQLLAAAPEPVRFSASIQGDPESFLAQAERLGLEGLIAKQADSPYLPGRRTRTWLKMKVQQQQEFVIGGYTEPKGARSHFGAIIVGVYHGRDLHYVGRVGTGFNERSLRDAHRKFQPLKTKTCPFVNLPAARKRSFGGGLTRAEMKHCTWLKPKLVCQIRFSGWTDDDSLRHPVFLGFRDDKNPREVVREIATAAA